MPDIVSVVNTILGNGTSEYIARVPVATRNNIAAVANPILTYASTQNEFLTAIVNKIAFTMVQKKIWANPLAILKKGSKPLGLDIENLHTNPAADAGYDRTGAGLLSTTTPDVKAEYFRMNRASQYKATIWDDDLRLAFTSWENLGNLIEEIVNSLYTGDYIDEFILMKNTLADGVRNQKMITAGITAITSAATANLFIADVKNMSSAMTYPSTGLNAYAKAGGTGNAVTTFTPKDKQLLIIRSDVLNYIDVNVLAAAYNIGKSEFMGRVLEVDNFGSMSNITAILADEGLMQVWEDMSRMTQFVNAQGLYTNYFWTHKQTYALSLLANAVAFVDDSSVPIAPVVTAPAAAATVIAGTGEAGSYVFATSAGVTKNMKVAANGTWSLSGYPAMVQNANVSAFQIDLAGNKSPVHTVAVTA